jgi:hypothetical protein
LGIAQCYFCLQDCTSTARYHKPLAPQTAILTPTQEALMKKERKKKEKRKSEQELLLHGFCFVAPLKKMLIS